MGSFECTHTLSQSQNKPIMPSRYSPYPQGIPGQIIPGQGIYPQTGGIPGQYPQTGGIPGQAYPGQMGGQGMMYPPDSEDICEDFGANQQACMQHAMLNGCVWDCMG